MEQKRSNNTTKVYKYSLNIAEAESVNNICSHIDDEVTTMHLNTASAIKCNRTSIQIDHLHQTNTTHHANFFVSISNNNYYHYLFGYDTITQQVRQNYE